jgi:formiminotetrahydrofolate cyclodeaminase
LTNQLLQNPANMTLASLFAAAASTAPTPGGGTVTAIGGYLGVSLLLKSIRVSARRQPDGIYPSFEDKLLRLASQLLTAAQADSDAFAQYVRAMQLPKTTAAEQTARLQAMHEAGIAATASALDILDLGNEVLDCAHQLQDRVIAAIRADARACIEIVSAMNIIARENALSNLAATDSADTLRQRLATATDRYQELIAACHTPS